MNLDLEFYQKILEASHDEICVSDDKGIIIYCNKAFEENYGLKKEDILGKNVSFLEDSGYSTKSPIPIVLKTKTKFSLEQDTQTGKKLIITATPIFDENGHLEFTVENCRDITELNNIKNKLEDTKKQVKKYKSEVETLYRTALRIEDTVIMDGIVMRPIINTVNHVSKTDVSVLLLGESGTGKSSLARYIHHNSNRSNGPFITINCATISPQLLESELFGYTSGAFTGASTKGKVGLVELANGGTLFLDEINSLSFNIQTKLLRVIEERQIMRIGSDYIIPLDIRIIAATNESLTEKIVMGTFRADLFYRLSSLEINIPPLRDRREDIIPLFNNFVNEVLKDDGLNGINSIDENFVLTKDEMDKLYNYSWPGNVRELKTIAQKYVVTGKIKLRQDRDFKTKKLLPNSEVDKFNSETTASVEVQDESINISKINDGKISIDIKEVNKYVEEKIISMLFAQGLSKNEVAQVLGISRTSLWKKYNKNI